MKVEPSPDSEPVEIFNTYENNNEDQNLLNPYEYEEIGAIDWSPDGNSIYFITNYRICKIDDDGTNLQSLYNLNLDYLDHHYICGLDVSSSGQYIAYGIYYDDEFQVSVLDVASEGIVKTIHNASFPVFSSNEDCIYYHQKNNYDSPGKLYRYDITVNDKEFITNGSYPALSPGENTIYFANDYGNIDWLNIN